MHREDTHPRSRSDWPPTTFHLVPDDANESARTNEGASPDETTPVSEIMTRNVFCATPDMALDALAYILVDQGISGAPVVDEHGRPLGMVSKTDVLREMSRRTRGQDSLLEWDGAPRETKVTQSELELSYLAERTALDAMTPIVYWLHEDASIAQASALMAYEHVHTIPIVSKSGKVTGVISTLDILRWIARRKGYLIPL